MPYCLYYFALDIHAQELLCKNLPPVVMHIPNMYFLCQQNMLLALQQRLIVVSTGLPVQIFNVRNVSHI